MLLASEYCFSPTTAFPHNRNTVEACIFFFLGGGGGVFNLQQSAPQKPPGSPVYINVDTGVDTGYSEGGGGVMATTSRGGDRPCRGKITI